MIKPMLCKGQPSAFDDPRYLWEPKYDGVRAIVSVDGSDVRIQSRSGHDRSKHFPELKFAVKESVILDGEIVCYAGGSSTEQFNGIQHRNRSNGVLAASERYPATFEVFDILEARGMNLEHYPLIQRKMILNAILQETENVRLGKTYDSGTELFEKAKANLWEGIVGKLKSGLYYQNKREWLKVKMWQYGNFVIVGYTEGTGWRASSFGALVLADLKGNFVGEVGTGFNDEEIRKLMGLMTPASCPWSSPPEVATWIKPMIARIRYLEFTSDGMLRFPSYKGLVL